MGRKLSKGFLENLKSGKYAPIVKAVKNDSEMEMFLRGSYVTVYYKTLQILRIKPLGGPEVNGRYFGKSDECLQIEIDENGNPKKYGTWEAYFRQAKVKLSEYGAQIKGEKKAQQRLVAANRGDKSDYRIIDVEYAHNSILPKQNGRKDNKRFDALAVYVNQKNPDLFGLALIELKVGNGAIDGASGVADHFETTLKFVRKLQDNLKKQIHPNFNDFIDDLNAVIDQMQQLGLISSRSKLPYGLKPEVIFALAEYNFKSEKLLNEINGYGGKKGIWQIMAQEKMCMPFDVWFTDFNLGKNGDYQIVRKNMIKLDEVEKFIRLEREKY